ncbi:MAG TPA: FadR/GntR family transcriptional regulator [Anaerolineales bacterium]|nr:FadR/GntR family transcriptional regulator [Anaerolineales bacterium]
MKQSLRGQALYRSVVDHIKGYILDHDLHPGDPLPPEGQLADDLGVGRSSVREAVKSLQSLGIIEVRPGNGLFVRELNFDPMIEAFKFGMSFDTRTVEELLQVRIWLESAVIGDAVQRIGLEQIKELDAVLAAWEVQSRSGSESLEFDEEFHRILYSVLDNETLMRLFDVFWESFRSLEVDTIRSSDPVEELRAHRAIRDSVANGDAAQTRARLLDHFQHVRARLARHATAVVSRASP